MGQHRRFSCSKIPQHCRAPAVPTQTAARAAHWGATALLSSGGNSKGLISPSLEHPAGHCQQPPPPCPSTTCSPTRCLSKKHHGCHTAERTGPRHSQPIPVHLCSLAPSLLLPCPKRLKKNQEIKKLQHFKFALGFKTLATMTITSHR